jgi:hypothetical protein
VRRVWKLFCSLRLDRFAASPWDRLRDFWRREDSRQWS